MTASVRSIILGAVAALTLLALAAPAKAEVVRLRCDSAHMTLDIDLTNRTVFTLFDAGSPSQTASAEITDRFVMWDVSTSNTVRLRLDRATGVISERLRGTATDDGSWTCQRVGKPLF